MKDNKKSAGSKIAGFFKWIGNDIKEIGVTFKDGDWKTRLSFVIMGFGPLMRKLYARGINYYNHYLGGSIYGVQEAAEAYFGKSVSELNLSEAAVIAGMFKSPGYYSPIEYPERSEARRKTVLYLMNISLKKKKN